MDKLHSYGFDLNTLAWIHSYLTNREQHDVVDGSAFSDMLVVSEVYLKALCWELFSLFNNRDFNY